MIKRFSHFPFMRFYSQKMNSQFQISNNNHLLFQIYRYNPESNTKSTTQTYSINTKQCGPMVLDALIKIKNELYNDIINVGEFKIDITPTETN